MAMLWVKTFHIVLIASWFAGLFYLPRIYVNLAMETDPAARRRLLAMARKLLRFMTIIAVPALACGLWLWLVIGIGQGQGWVHAKLGVVLLLVVYHAYCGHLLKVFERGENRRSDKWYRVFNELPVLGMLAAVALATHRYGYPAAWLDFGPKGGAPAHGWWHCFVYYMGVWVLMMFTFDYARFGREADAGYHGRWNFGMPFYLVTFVVNGAAGIYLVSTIPGLGALSEVSVVTALLKLMGVWGLLFVWVTQSRINTANYYLATVNMQAFFQKAAGLRAPKYVWALVVGAVVYALMMADIFSKLLQALAWQGVFIVAWVGVALAHILSTRYEELLGSGIECRDTHVPAFNPGGLSAWFAGVFAGMMLTTATGFAQSLSAPVTFVVSWAVYRGMLASAKRTWFVRER